ncbi:MAG: HD domain-containing protein, partial [Pseudomonadota bacterium]
MNNDSKLACDPQKNIQDRPKNARLADFLFEAGMLRFTPRTGYQFLGTGSENVAEHSFRTAMVGFVLARMANIAPEHVVMICLFHDFHEARIGDFNYVNRIYNTTAPRAAMEHALQGTGLDDDVLPLWDELEAADTLEARLAHDADQIDFILN